MISKRSGVGQPQAVLVYLLGATKCPFCRLAFVFHSRYFVGLNYISPNGNKRPCGN